MFELPFKTTGVPEIDDLLWAIEEAAGRYRNVECWAEDGDESCISLIQKAADKGAAAIRARTPSNSCTKRKTSPASDPKGNSTSPKGGSSHP